MVTIAADGAARRTDRKTSQEIEALTASIKKAYADKAFDLALQLSEELLGEDPDNFVALRCKARVFAQQGAIDRAEVAWQRIVETSEDKGEAAVALARIAHGRGEWESMAQFADMARHAVPEHPDALRLGVQARIRGKQSENLPQMLSSLYRRDPERGLGFLRGMGGAELVQAQAATLALLKDITGSDQSLRSFTNTCREAWAAGVGRARGRLEDEAAATYLRAIWEFEQNCQSEVVERLHDLSRDRLRFLRMAIKKGDRADILRHAQSAAEFNPTLFEAWFAIARLVADDEPERAAACLKTCAALRPDDGYLKYREGLSLIRSGRPDEALMAFTEAKSRINDPTDPIFDAAAVECNGLRPRLIEQALIEARSGQLITAKAHFAAARASTLHGAPDSTGVTLADRAAFHSEVFLSTVRQGFRSLVAKSSAGLARARRRLIQMTSRRSPSGGSIGTPRK